MNDHTPLPGDAAESRSPSFGRPRKPKKEQKTFYLPEEVAEQLRIYAALHRETQSAIVIKALKRYLLTDSNSATHLRGVSTLEDRSL